MAEGSGPRRCRNCLATATHAYCPKCGQATREPRGPFRDLAADALSTWFSADGKLWSSLKTLCWHPGALTIAYREGRRARYLSPLRLYLFTSVLLFLLSHLGGGDGRSLVQIGGEGAAQTEAQEAAFASGVRRLVPWQDSWLGHALLQRMLAQADILDRLEAEQAQAILNARMMAALPWALFLAVPFFALALRLAFLRRPYFYADHFIFALHVQAFLFCLLILLRLMSWLPLRPGLWLGLIISSAVLMMTYFLRALKQCYGRAYLAGSLTALGSFLFMLPVSMLLLVGLFFSSLLGV